MRKFIAWVSIIVFGLLAAFIIMRRDQGSQSQLVTYSESKAYSITYPRGWLRVGGKQKSGFEILALYNYDYSNAEYFDDNFGPGQIKIALSIIDKPAKPLAQIIADQYPETDQNLFKKEIVMPDGRQAIRLSGDFEANGEKFSKIETYIEYNDHQYAMLSGYYNGDDTTAKIIDTIHASFKILKSDY